MGKFLPLYTEAHLATVVERTEPIDSATGLGVCQRCSLYQEARPSSVCMQTGAVGGGTGGLLIVGEMPGKSEDSLGLPFVGRAGRLLQKQVERHWDGPVAYTNALLCYPGKDRQGLGKKGKNTAKLIERCRPHLAHTIAETKPRRIIALGSVAAQALLGSALPPYSVRRGYGYLSDGTPVYYGIHPEAALKNTFVKQWFMSDLEWMIKSKVPSPTEHDAEFQMIETQADAERACAELLDAEWFAYDTEYAGRPFDEYFEVLCLAACSKGSDYPYVWSRAALTNPATSAPLFALMRNAKARKVGHNLKVDMMALRAEFGVDVKGCHMDTMNERRLLIADSDAGLATVAGTIGMGGHKKEAQDALVSASAEISRARIMARAALKDPDVKELLYLPGTVHPAVLAACRLVDLEPLAFAYALIDKTVLHRYCALDTLATVRIGEDQRPKLVRSGISIIADKVVTPATKAFEQIEAWGMAAGAENMAIFNDHLRSELGELNTRITGRLGTGFNPAAADDVAHLMYNRLQIPIRDRDRTPTGKPGTGAKIITRHAKQNPILHDILEHRRISNLLGTYSEGLNAHVRADGRIHPNIKITGTECMPAGELVLTSRGCIPVEKVKVGDSVLGHSGRPRKVVKAQRLGKDPIQRTTLANRMKLRTNAAHEFLTDTGWVRADELHVGQRVRVHGKAECWRSVTDWPYEVSSWGRVRRTEHAYDVVSTCLLQQPKGCWGHLKVALRRNGRACRGPDYRDFSIHRLVAVAFLGEAEAGMEVSHVNGIAWDNSVENLKWATPQENRDQAVRHCTMLHRKPTQNVLSAADIKTILSTPRTSISDTVLAKTLGVSRSLVSRIRRGEQHARREPTQNTAKFGWSKVCATILENVEVVYGLTVETDHSHVTGGVVTHNTGRPSCAEPNLQNWPRADTYEGKLARNCLVAPPGFELLELDYSQIEIRVGAMLSGDPDMIGCYLRGEDLHWKTTRLISQDAWGLPPGQVTKVHRTESKKVTFGLMYGKTDMGLAEELGISLEQAGVLRKAILGAYPMFNKWCQQQHALVQETGEAWTWWDGLWARRRPLWRIADDVDFNGRPSAASNTARNSAINTPIQGTASEYCVASAVETVKACLQGRIPAKLVITIHDALVLECRTEHVDQVARAVQKIMVRWPTCAGMPLVVDFKRGHALGSITDYELPE